MFKKIEFALAYKFLKAKKTESFISVVSIFSLIGMSLGVASLIVVMSVMNGFETELSKKIISFEGDISINSFSEEYLDEYNKIISDIDQLPFINAIFPTIEKKILITNKLGVNAGVQLKGVQSQDLAYKVKNFKGFNIKNFNSIEDGYNIILGKGVAKNLNISLGDEIKVISPESSVTLLGYVPNFKKFKVSGFFESGMSEYDNITAFVSIDSAQKLFKTQGVNLIELYSVNPKKSSIYKYTIMNKLTNGLEVNDWQTKNMAFFSALKTERAVMFLILTLIILVAAFNIVSSLIMLVRDKHQNIGVLRTMGLSKMSIVRIFFICGCSLGLVGTVSGGILGYLFANNIDAIKTILESYGNTSLFNPVVYYLSELPSEVLSSDLYKIFSISIFLSLIATIYPSYRAADIDPIKVLKT